ncbi:MAG TPA: hypothetical protein VFR05_09880, partial [Terriglobia bacterium]|nr:hypothetical protein [Terriglobia bacterium]
LSEPRIGPLAGSRVVIEGTGRRWETHSDEQGRYEISGLPAGTYEVKPQPGPDSLARFYPPSTQVKVVERACATADAYAQVHGRISGRLTDGNGKPIPDQAIRIMPEALSPLDARSWDLPYAFTKEDGSYEFATLPSGRYVLGVNVASPPQPLRPDDAVYPRTYFPSARERADAQVIALTAGSEQRDVNIVLPGPLQKRAIRGTVLWTDGKRVKGAGVSLSNPEYAAGHNQFAQSDDNGEFTFDVYEGLPYMVVASSRNDPYGKPLRASVASPPTPADRERILVALPYPATLKGRLVDALGKPQPDVEVELIPEETRRWEAGRIFSPKARSNSQGIFEISGLSPRRYVLAIHASSPPVQSEKYAYPPAFYPGTGDRNLAEVIVIKEGQQAELSDFVLPPRLVPEVVRGVAVWPDGRPVQSGFFAVEDPDFPGSTYVANGPIAVDGRFEMSLFVGRRYAIQAMTDKDQEGRGVSRILQTKPAEFRVDSKSEELRLRMGNQ